MPIDPWIISGHGLMSDIPWPEQGIDRLYRSAMPLGNRNQKTRPAPTTKLLARQATKVDCQWIFSDIPDHNHRTQKTKVKNNGFQKDSFRFRPSREKLIRRRNGNGRFFWGCLPGCLEWAREDTYLMAVWAASWPSENESNPNRNPFFLSWRRFWPFGIPFFLL